MKILHVGKYYPPYHGGMETVLWNISTGLLDRDHDLAVLVSGLTADRNEDVVSGTETGRSGRLVRVPRFGVVNSQPILPTLLLELRRLLDEFSPDLVQLHFPNPLLAVAWLALERLVGPPATVLTVWYHADITRQRLGGRLVAPAVRACLDRACGICVSSRSLLDGSPYLRPFTRKTAVIPFGIAPEPWIDIQARGDGPFLFVGRLVRYKGLMTLLAALARVPDARLTVIGEGPLRGRLSEELSRLGLADRVDLLGTVSQAVFRNHLADARALVLPSLDRSETFGLVQLEAMAAGVPVVASDLPSGVGEVGLSDQTGLLVPPGDSAALAAAMARLQNDARLARNMGQAARRRFLERFRRDDMIDRLLTGMTSSWNLKGPPRELRFRRPLASLPATGGRARRRRVRIRRQDHLAACVRRHVRRPRRTDDPDDHDPHRTPGWFHTLALVGTGSRTRLGRPPTDSCTPAWPTTASGWGWSRTRWTVWARSCPRVSFWPRSMERPSTRSSCIARVNPSGRGGRHWRLWSWGRPPSAPRPVVSSTVWGGSPMDR